MCLNAASKYSLGVVATVQLFVKQHNHRFAGDIITPETLHIITEQKDDFNCHYMPVMSLQSATDRNEHF